MIWFDGDQSKIFRAVKKGGGDSGYCVLELSKRGSICRAKR